MSNTPFNQQITNALERPTSSGLNLGFANYDVQALALSLLQDTAHTPGMGSSGFVGSSFAVVPTSPPSAQVYISRGVAFANGASGPSNINGITGLNDAFDYKVMYTNARLIDVAPPCSSGNIRRDLIMIKPKASLTDTAATDIYQPSVNAFSALSRYHTLSRDFTNASEAPLVTLAVGGVPGANDYLVYKMGVEVPAASGYLAASIPSVDSGYMPIAVINVSDTASAGYAPNVINDYRTLVHSAGVLPISGEARIGSTFPYTGDVLDTVAIKTIPSVKVALRKTGGGTHMQYKFYVLAGGGASVDFQIGGDVRVYQKLNNGAVFSFGSYAAPLLASWEIVDTALQSALNDSGQTVPTMSTAIGQLVYTYEFAVGAPTYDATTATGLRWDTTQPNFGKNGVPEITAAYINFNLTLQK